MDTSYLTSQVNSIVGQLHGLFDEIGVSNHDRKSREQELFASLSDTLQSHLRRADCEKSDMISEAQQIIELIKQMEASLDDVAKHDRKVEDPELRVTFPLNLCLKVLKEKYAIISKIHRERFEQIKKLARALESYSSHLEPSFVMIPLPPTTDGASIPTSFDLSPSYAAELDKEFTRVYEEYTRRVQVVQSISEEIVKLWVELGTPQAQTDASIIKHHRESPEQLGLHDSDLASLREIRDKLIEEKRGRERKQKELRTAVESLWERLGIEESDRKSFLAANRGCSLRAINEFQDELNRLNELKRQNLHLFIEDARCRLQGLWDSLYYSEEEMLDFTPAFSDVYSDALLLAHEAEIERLETLREQRAPTLELIEKHRTLVNDRNALAASSQDASRLMARGNKGERRDPTRLLREEKMRKRIAKELPKVEAELRRILEQWENEYGRPFLVHGERYLDEIQPPAPAKIPPRSKTPCVPSQNSRANSVRTPSSMRGGGSIRGLQPPFHSKTPTGNGTLRRNAGNPTIENGIKSPSKIPGRVPLSNMPFGNNSPDRRPPQSHSSDVRSKMPPPRAPPPKMRDLASIARQETPQNSFYADTERCNSAMSLSTSYVRQISQEDICDDRNQHSYMGSSTSHYRPESPQSTFKPFNPAASLQDLNYYNHQRHQSQPQPTCYMQQSHHPEPMGPPPRPASRQISNTSTVTTSTSRSENWETYDDASEPEIDATDVYYAKMRAAQGKLQNVDSSTMNGKKFKGIRGVGMEENFVEENGQITRIVGSDAGWTDDMETY
ncbi:hypothetical protein GX48_06343 [Paracoccidioides brasiliensis]|nr:hypothetical protein GX48_06343 [Paracoccidioides brasiliensis]